LSKKILFLPTVRQPYLLAEGTAASAASRHRTPNYKPKELQHRAASRTTSENASRTYVSLKNLLYEIIA